MKNDLDKFTQDFFQNYLPKERELSQHTIYSYRDTIKLFFKFIVSKYGKKKKANLDDMSAKNVLEFIEYLKTSRRNTTKTQNQRLAVLKSFLGYLRANDPIRMSQYDRIQHIKMKRPEHVPIEYLDKNEMKAIFAAIDLNTQNGKRDNAILKLLYNSGARVQEICNLTVADIRLTPPYLVKLKGKGKKTRQVPLWKETVQAVKPIVMNKEPFESIFCFRTATLSRFGIRYIVKKYCEKASLNCSSMKDKTIGPHTFRHTTAMHLLQSGVDISVIKTWLGHVDLNTTHGYVEIDMEMKRKAMQHLNFSKNDDCIKKLLSKNQDIIKWLTDI